MKDKIVDILGAIISFIFIVLFSVLITIVLKDLQKECTKRETREKEVCHTYGLFSYHTECHVETEDYCVEYEGDKND